MSENNSPPDRNSGKAKADYERFHRRLVDHVVESLQEIFGEDGKYADKVVQRHMRGQRKWGARDRRFYAESVYDCVRWWRKLWFMLGEEPNQDPVKLLRIWALAYQMGERELPDWRELYDLPTAPMIEFKLAKAPRAILESIPDWLDNLGVQEMGTRWDSILQSLNDKATVDLRVNSLKDSRESVRQKLFDEGIETEEIADCPSGVVLTERKNVFVTKAYMAGLFEVQDRASQKVAALLNPQSGDRVIDACAGAGGKTLHLAALMKNKGRIIAMDIHDWKLEELKVRAKRNGVTCVETRLIGTTKVVKRQEASADKVLLDVPCSGLGVLRRNPDSKWKFSAKELGDLQGKQAEILRMYAKMVKPGGQLVYATCSFLHSENEKQVEKFLAENQGWTLLKSLRNDPDQGQGDGFFAALLQKQ